MKKFRDRAPHTRMEDDGEWWYCDGLKITTGFGFGGAQTGRRFESPEDVDQRRCVCKRPAWGLHP